MSTRQGVRICGPRQGTTRVLRSLNQPTAIRVGITEAGNPEWIEWRRKKLWVAQIGDCWRIDDEWWRSPISRRYLQIVLDNGVMMTVYHDMEEDRWYMQGG